MKTIEQTLEWIEDKIEMHQQILRTCYTTEAYDEAIKVLKCLKKFILEGKEDI